MKVNAISILMMMHLGQSEKIYTSYQPLVLQSSASNQCTSSDKQLWQSSPNASVKFFQDIALCSFQGAGSTDLSQNITQCLTSMNPNLSESCARCFAEDVDCGATNCRVPCQQDVSSSQCQICLQPCTQSLSSCTGTVYLPSTQAVPTTTTTTTSAGAGMFGGTSFISVAFVMVWMFS